MPIRRMRCAGSSRIKTWKRPESWIRSRSWRWALARSMKTRLLRRLLRSRLQRPFCQARSLRLRQRPFHLRQPPQRLSPPRTQARSASYISQSAATSVPLAAECNGSVDVRISDSAMGNSLARSAFSKRSWNPAGIAVPPLSTSGTGCLSFGSCAVFEMHRASTSPASGSRHRNRRSTRGTPCSRRNR